MLNHPMLIAVILLPFKLEDKEKPHEEVASHWAALRDFNCKHSNSYIMPQFTDQQTSLTNRLYGPTINNGSYSNIVNGNRLYINVNGNCPVINST